MNCEIERWRCDPSGPQVSCPAALAKRHPTVLQLALPVSRRLNADTVSIIQPAFYPDMPFRAMSRARSVRFAPARDRALGIDDDPEYQGWRAHLTLLAALSRANRMFPAVHGLAPSNAAYFGAWK